MKRDGIGRWFNKNLTTKEEDEKVKPIRNIFKMSRILVDVKPKSKKDSKSKLDKINEKKDNSSIERNSATGSDDNAITDKGSDEGYEYSESSDQSDEESLEENG